VDVYSLPNIENEFNILIPVRNQAGTYPTQLVVTFSTQDLSFNGVTKLPYVRNAFRVYGPPVTGSLTLPTPVINVNNLGLNRAGLDFTTDW
jgi:hypothetical protein